MNANQTCAQQFSDRLKDLLRNEHTALVAFLAALAEFDHHKLYLPLGYCSTWSYLRFGLGQSESMAHYRLSAARLLRRFPQLQVLLREGKLCMTHLSDLAPVLRADNCQALLAEAMGKSRDELKRLVARIQPKPVPRVAALTVPLPPVVPAAQASSAPAPAPTPRQVSTSAVQTEMLTEAFARKHLTVDREYEQLLARAKDALSHTMPAAPELAILKEGLRRIIRDHDRRKAVTDRPRAPRTPPLAAARNAAIPAAVRREVWQRDQGRCQWPRPDGGICGSTYRVQFHHLRDRGKGGAHTAENLRLACQRHNLYAAELSWGKCVIDRFRKTIPVPRPGEAVPTG